jgi:hypothetical protein
MCLCKILHTQFIKFTSSNNKFLEPTFTSLFIYFAFLWTFLLSLYFSLHFGRHSAGLRGRMAVPSWIELQLQRSSTGQRWRHQRACCCALPSHSAPPPPLASSRPPHPPLPPTHRPLTRCHHASPQLLRTPRPLWPSIAPASSMRQVPALLPLVLHSISKHPLIVSWSPNLLIAYFRSGFVGDACLGLRFRV